MTATIKKDELGLFADFDGWRHRPMTSTALREGQTVDVLSAFGLATQVRPAATDGVHSVVSSDPGEAWARTGVAGYLGSTPSRNLRYAKEAAKADVARLQSMLDAGADPANAFRSANQAGPQFQDGEGHAALRERRAG